MTEELELPNQLSFNKLIFRISGSEFPYSSKQKDFISQQTKKFMLVGNGEKHSVR
jgi:hypothetical protein